MLTIVSLCTLTFIRIIFSVYYKTDDPTKRIAILALMSTLEPLIGVVVACMPFLPPAFGRVSQASVFARASISFRSITKGKSQEDTGTIPTSGTRRVGHPDPYKELPNLEMSAVRTPNFQRYCVGPGPQGSIRESGPWDHFGGQDRIFVRNDFLVETERP